MIEETTVVPHCGYRCPFFAKGSYGQGASDPDECLHPVFGVPHRCYTSIISYEEMYDREFPRFCPLKNEAVQLTIIRKDRCL